jgi:hypothetical protein
MSYPPRPQTTNLRASFERRRARVPGGRLALAGCFRPPTRCQILLASDRGENAYQIARSLGCNPQSARNAIHIFNEGALQAALSRGSSRPRTIHAAFDSEGAERLREVLHQNPRRFDKDRAACGRLPWLRR